MQFMFIQHMQFKTASNPEMLKEATGFAGGYLLTRLSHYVYRMI